MTSAHIGVTVGRRLLAAESGQRQDAVFACPVDYCREIERAGAIPLLIPPWPQTGALIAEAARALAERMNGLLLTGGGDVDPVLFGEEPHPRIGVIDAQRDATEIALIHAAMERGLPVLAICRGIQVLNVALGGGLIQHLDSARQGAICHNQPGPATAPFHTIQIEPDTILARVMGEGEHRVNSTHHQALDEPAAGLIVSARACDGVIEAVESLEGAPIVGVQFHPERMAPDDSACRALFEWLVRESRIRATRG